MISDQIALYLVQLSYIPKIPFQFIKITLSAIIHLHFNDTFFFISKTLDKRNIRHDEGTIRDPEGNRSPSRGGRYCIKQKEYY